MDNSVLPTNPPVVIKIEKIEDEEVVLKGSELDSILNLHQIKTETYLRDPRTSRENPVPNLPAEDPRLEGDPGVIEVLKQLLESGLLLDEDAATLAEYCDNINHKSTVGRFDHRLTLILLAGCISIGRPRWRFLTLFVSSVGLTTIFFVNKYRSLSRKKSIDRLTSEMGEMSKVLKKVILHIKETTVSVDSRNFLLNNRNAALNEVFYAKLKSDLTCYSNSAVDFVLRVINLTRDATRNNVLTCFANRKDLFFISFLGSEEFGLPEENCRNLPLQKIEELFYVYLLLQSEHLKSVGLMFYLEKGDRLWNSMQRVDSFVGPFAEILLTARRQLSSGIYSTFSRERAVSSKKFNSKDIEYAQLEEVLSRTLRDAYNLKAFMSDKESISSADADYLLMGLKSIESTLSDFVAVNKKVQKMLNKGENVASESDNLTNIVEDRSIVKTQVEVGHSDFSVAAEDNVYMSIGDFNAPEDVQDAASEHTPVYPKNLLIELKGALEGRRTLFRQRESEAITRHYAPEMVREFDEDEEAQALEAVESRKERRRQALNTINQMTTPTDTYLQTSGEMDLQKKIAHSVANISLAWKNTDDECFGDSEDESE